MIKLMKSMISLFCQKRIFFGNILSAFMVLKLSAVLTKYGHKVNLETIDDWNRVEISVNGETVFTCDIRDLDYGKSVIKPW